MIETATRTKPSFRETRRVITMDLKDRGLSFNSVGVGPGSFIGLREANYGEGFVMPTIGQMSRLVYAALENSKDYETAREVVSTLRNHWLIGNTGILWTPSGMYAQDRPEIKNDRVYMDESSLKEKLGLCQEGDVVYSDDETVRFTPYGFKVETQSALDLSRNAGIITLFGGEEEADAIAQVSQHYKMNPRFLTFESVDSPKVGVPALYSSGFGGGFVVGGDWIGSGSYGLSFGVNESGEEADARE
ncbi:MAG: hypothetical protein IIA87_02755 [Nanoarchaeota archaeon]|nr:hypothetical protein [Nanoarchaeota archaeon]